MNYKVTDVDENDYTHKNSSGIVVTETGALLIKGKDSGNVIAAYNKEEWIRIVEAIN